MKILISAGHTLRGKGTGAEGYINESNENRILAKKVVAYLKMTGNEVDYHEVNEASNYLQQQVSFANKKDYDLVVQIHFNAHKKVTQTMGTETLYSSNKGKAYANTVNDKLKTVFKNRGIKHRYDLYWLNNTKAPAILVETCFVDSLNDTDMYKMNKDRIGKLIAEGILNKDIEEPTSSDDKFYKVYLGAFKDKNNAVNLKNEAIAKGFKGAYINHE